MMTMAMMAADMVNMMAGSSMTTAAPTLVWKNPIAASQPLQGARERVGAGSPTDGGPRPRTPESCDAEEARGLPRAGQCARGRPR